MGGFLRIVLCAFVALSISAFVPSCIATADTFETPKTLFWCLALAVAGLCGLVSAQLPKRRGADDWTAWALLVWMALRTIAAGELFDWTVLVGWLLPPILFLAGSALSMAGSNRLPVAGGGFVGSRMQSGAGGRSSAVDCLRLPATDKTTARLAAIIGVVGAAQALLMLLQRIGLDPLFAVTTSAQTYLPGRMIGTIGYHNQAVDLLAVCTALWLWCQARHCKKPGAIDSRQPKLGNRLPSVTGNRQNNRSTAGKTSAVLLPVALLGAIATLTAYRAGFAGVLAGVVALSSGRSWRGRRSVSAALALAVALCAICLAVPQMRERTVDALSHPFATPALRTRATMARAAWAMIRERPLFGHGSGAYAFQYMRRVADGMPDEPAHGDLQRVVYAREPHNDFLHIWSEFGLVGLVLVLCWLIASWRNQPPAGRFLMGYWLVASCFGFPWHDTAAGPLFGLVLGMMGGAFVGSRTQSAADSRSSATDCPRLSAIDKTNARQPIAIGHRLSTIIFLCLGFVGAALCALQIGADAALWRAFSWQGRALAREGGLLAMEGQYAEAEKRLEASRRSERSPEQCNNLGFVKMKLGKPAAAEAIYLEWDACGIAYEKALKSLAGAQEAQGKWLDAGQTLYRLHRLYPSESTDADLFRTVSLLLRGGDAETALRLVCRFWRLNGKSTRWTAEWENLFGAAELRRGNTGNARAHFLRSLEMKPSLDSARRNLEALDRR